jgi:uncharacterized protein (TIGR00730 family)
LPGLGSGGEDGAMRSVCVFCGSNPGRRPEYLAAAAELGQALAGRGLRVVYGGAHVGAMGALADAVLATGGEITGVIPGQLVEAEVAHRGLADLRVVGSMHERKALMADLSDAFIALPGGLGTLEEFAEILTWAQLGLHAKPAGLLNVAGYYDGLLAFLDHAQAEYFLRPAHRDMIISRPDVAGLLAAVEAATARAPAPVAHKWMDSGGADLIPGLSGGPGHADVPEAADGPGPDRRGA